MRKKVKIKPIQESEKLLIYSICNIEKAGTEFEKFLLEHKDKAEVRTDFHKIVKWIDKISERGALERYFRPESRMKDGVCAIPIEYNRLRLYCLRLTDEILIIGNGGIKNTATYEENSFLNECVKTLAALDNALKNELRKGKIAIQGKVLTNIEDKIFTLNI